MTVPDSLAAVHLHMGNIDFYIPASEVLRCSLVREAQSEIPLFSHWLGLKEEPHQGMHLHLLVPGSNVLTGWTLWGELENVILAREAIFALPPLVRESCKIPVLRALVNSHNGLSPLLSWGKKKP